MAYLSKLIKQFEAKTDWSNPGPDVVAEFKQAIQPYIQHEFDMESYLFTGNFLREILPSVFNVHGKDWSQVLEGKNRIKDHLAKPGIKLVFIPGPHNSHLDEAILGLAFYDSGIGDLRVGARTNMFIGPGRKLKKLGSWAMSFYERMPSRMRFAANDAVFDYLQKTLIPEANFAIRPRSKTPGAKIAAHPVMFMHDGRSYDGTLKPRKEGNIERLLRMQDETESEILIVPLTESILFSPEEAAFPKLLSADKTKPAKYLLTDYGILASSILKHYILRNIKDLPKSDVYLEIHKPVNLKRLVHPEWYRWGIKRKRKHLADIIEKEIVSNYKVMPEKLFAAALVQDESFLKGHPEKLTDYVSPVEKLYEQLRRNGRRTELLPRDPRKIIDVALPYYIKSGTMRYENGKIKAKKPFRIEYQANTIRHLLK